VFETVVTFVTHEVDEASGQSIAYTKVFRLEFESEDGFMLWLKSAQYRYNDNKELADRIGCTNAEVLTATNEL
jgi:hypothetical protein